MPPLIATGVFGLAIYGLFRLERDPNVRASKAVWISVVWIALSSSKTVSQWMQTGVALTVDQNLEGNPLERFIYSAILALGILVLSRRGSRVWSVLRRNGPILLFVAYGAASVLWSDFPDVAFKRWTKSLGDFVIALIILTDLDACAAAKRFLMYASFLLIPISVLLVKYYPGLGMTYKHSWEAHVAVGITNDKNMLGVICLLFGLGAVWRIVWAFRGEDVPHRNRSVIAEAMLIAMVLWLLLRADSMTSLACFVFGAGLIVITTFAAVRNSAVVHLLVGTTLVVAFSVLFLNVSSGILNSIGRDSTLTGRTEIWHEVIGLSGNPLIGTGFESFWLGPRLEAMWSKHWWHPNEAHNGYIEVYLNLGWLGLALLFAVVANGYRNCIRILRRNPELGGLKVTFLVIALIYSFTEAGFRMMLPIWSFFLFGAFAIPHSHSGQVCGKPDDTAKSKVAEHWYAEA